VDAVDRLPTRERAIDDAARELHPLDGLPVERDAYVIARDAQDILDGEIEPRDDDALAHGAAPPSAPPAAAAGGSSCARSAAPCAARNVRATAATDRLPKSTSAFMRRISASGMLSRRACKSGASEGRRASVSLRIMTTGS